MRTPGGFQEVSARLKPEPTRQLAALSLLCVVQGCERFASYAVLPLFVLYLCHRHGLSEPSALIVLSVFQTLSYVGALPAGAITDRKLSPMAAARIGAALLSFGYGGLALDMSVLLWPALGFLVLGHSFFRPTMASLFGEIFHIADQRRDRAFLFYHLATNLGALAGPLCAEAARARSGWSSTFHWSAVIMLGGTLLLMVGGHLLRIHSPKSPDATASADQPAVDKQRVRAVWLVCLVSIVFWLTALQSGSSLALFAEQNTLHTLWLGHRQLIIGPGHFAALHALLVAVLMPILIAGAAGLRRRALEPSTPAKMIWGYLLTAAAFAILIWAAVRGSAIGRVSPVWLGGSYVILSAAELLLAPWEWRSLRSLHQWRSDPKQWGCGLQQLLPATC